MLSADLGIGTTFDSFQVWGKHPRVIDMLNSFVMEGAMLWAVAFSIRPEILSGPLDLDTSIFCSRCMISSSVHRIFSGHSLDVVNLWQSRGVSGGSFVLKHCEKKLLSMFALSLSLCADEPSWDNTGMVFCSFRRYFIVFQNCFLSAVLSLLIKESLFSIAKHCNSLVSCSPVLSHVSRNTCSFCSSVQVVTFLHSLE